MPDTILSDLQRIQNTAARILTKCGDRNYPSINLLKKLPWLLVRQRITYKIFILTIKAYHKTAPLYICDLIIGSTMVANSHAYGVILTHLTCYSRTHAIDKFTHAFKKNHTHTHAIL